MVRISKQTVQALEFYIYEQDKDLSKTLSSVTLERREKKNRDKLGLENRQREILMICTTCVEIYEMKAGFTSFMFVSRCGSFSYSSV